MELIYIDHSGFVIEGKDFALLFDYYQDTPDRYVHQKFLQRPGRLYILSTHSHPDHFNPEILDWKTERPDIRYILSEDIRDQGKACYHDAVFLKKGEEWNDDLLKVKAFGSTDIGISFLVDVMDKKIFHAGDLNNWHWREESTPQEISEAETAYLNELETLAQYTDYVDLAMFPVDPRLGEDYALGARQFINRIRTRQFVPMHFWKDYEKANAFRPWVEKQGGRFIPAEKSSEVKAYSI